MAGFCGSCGTARQGADAFCQSCGMAFAADQSGAEPLVTAANAPAGMSDVKERWHAASRGEKVLLIAGCVGFVSLFLPWLDAGLVTRSGWQETGWIWFGLVFSYPAYAVFSGKAGHRTAYVALALVGLVLTIITWSSNTQSVQADGLIFQEDQWWNFNGAGVYVFFLATVGALAGALLHPKPS